VAIVGGQKKEYRRLVGMDEYTPWVKTEGKGKLGSYHLPCTFQTPMIDYMNIEDVRRALKVKDDLPAWNICSDTLKYGKADKEGSQWVYEKLKGKYRILFYSGDTDGCVATQGSLNWIGTLAWSIKEAWRPYYYDS